MQFGGHSGASHTPGLDGADVMDTANDAAVTEGSRACENTGGAAGCDLGQQQASGPTKCGVSRRVIERGQQAASARQADRPFIHQEGALALVVFFHARDRRIGVDGHTREKGVEARRALRVQRRTQNSRQSCD